MMPFFIRPMSKGDIPYVHSLALDSLDEYYSDEIFTLFLEQWPGGQYVACRYDGTVVGFICGSNLGPDRIGIALFAVNRSSRGKGIGSKLLATLRQSGTLRGALTIQLEVRTENESALDFYKKRGFVTAEILHSYYRNNGDAIRMLGMCSVNS